MPTSSPDEPSADGAAVTPDATKAADHSPHNESSGPNPIGWGLVLVGGGVVWMLHLAGVTINWRLVVPIGLITIGIVLLLGGRRVERSGLVGLGIALAIVAVIMSLAPLEVSASAGERNYTVATVAELEPSYSLGAGSLTLDLRELELPTGTTEVRVSVSVGELVVVIPNGVSVTGSGHTLAGEVESFGGTTAGVAPRRQLRYEAAPDAPVLDLHLRVGLGRIAVTR